MIIGGINMTIEGTNELAFELYKKDWVKTKHNSFMPDWYLWTTVFTSHEKLPYLIKADKQLKMEHRVKKLKKLRNKI